MVGNSSIGSSLPIELCYSLPLYHPTKAYMDSFTRMLAAAHPTIKAININCLFVDTPMAKSIFDGTPKYEKDKMASMGVPVGDHSSMCAALNGNMGSSPLSGAALIEPSFVADVVLSVCNGISKYLSGQCISIVPGATVNHIESYERTYGLAAYDFAASWHPHMNDARGHSLGLCRSPPTEKHSTDQPTTTMAAMNDVTGCQSEAQTTSVMTPLSFENPSIERDSRHVGVFKSCPGARCHARVHCPLPFDRAQVGNVVQPQRARNCFAFSGVDDGVAQETRTQAGQCAAPHA